MTADEEWFDREIAPELRRLCEACVARGMSFVSAVEYEPGHWSDTHQLSANASLSMLMINHCVRTAPNLDAYVIGVIKHCQEKGIDLGDSLVAHRLLRAEG